MLQTKLLCCVVLPRQTTHFISTEWSFITEVKDISDVIEVSDDLDPDHTLIEAIRVIGLHLEDVYNCFTAKRECQPNPDNHFGACPQCNTIQVLKETKKQPIVVPGISRCQLGETGDHQSIWRSPSQHHSIKHSPQCPSIKVQ